MPPSMYRLTIAALLLPALCIAVPVPHSGSAIQGTSSNPVALNSHLDKRWLPEIPGASGDGKGKGNSGNPHQSTQQTEPADSSDQPAAPITVPLPESGSSSESGSRPERPNPNDHPKGKTNPNRPQENPGEPSTNSDSSQAAPGNPSSQPGSGSTGDLPPPPPSMKKRQHKSPTGDGGKTNPTRPQPDTDHPEPVDSSTGFPPANPLPNSGSVSGSSPRPQRPGAGDGQSKGNPGNPEGHVGPDGDSNDNGVQSAPGIHPAQPGSGSPDNHPLPPAPPHK